MVEAILQMAIAAAAAALAVAAPILVPVARRWFVEKAQLEHIVGEGKLAERLDQGVIAIIEQVIEEMQAAKGKRHLADAEVADAATTKVEHTFEQTLARLNLDHKATRDYVKRRTRRLNSRDGMLGR